MTSELHSSGGHLALIASHVSRDHRLIALAAKYLVPMALGVSLGLIKSV